MALARVIITKEPTKDMVANVNILLSLAAVTVMGEIAVMGGTYDPQMVSADADALFRRMVDDLVHSRPVMESEAAMIVSAINIAGGSAIVSKVN